MKKWFTTLSLAMLAGCSQENNNSSPAETPINQVNINKEDLEPQLFPEINAPRPTPVAALSKESSLSTTTTAQSTSGTANAEIPLEPLPSKFPVIMERVVDLRKQVDKYNADSGTIPESLENDIKDFYQVISDFVNSDAELSKVQREALEVAAGSATYQVELIKQRIESAPFANCLARLKENLRQVQLYLSTNPPEN